MDTSNWIALLAIGSSLFIVVIGYQWRLAQRVTNTEAKLPANISEKLTSLQAAVTGLAEKQDEDRKHTDKQILQLRDEITDSEKRTEKALDKLDTNVVRLHDRFDQLLTALPPPSAAPRRVRAKP